MSTTFHRTKAGRIEPCGATKRPCPLGESAHFESIKEAVAASLTVPSQELEEVTGAEIQSGDQFFNQRGELLAVLKIRGQRREGDIPADGTGLSGRGATLVSLLVRNETTGREGKLAINARGSIKRLRHGEALPAVEAEEHWTRIPGEGMFKNLLDSNGAVCGSIQFREDWFILGAHDAATRQLIMFPQSNFEDEEAAIQYFQRWLSENPTIHTMR